LLVRLGNNSIIRQRVLLVLGCALLFGVWLTWAPLTEIDEARFVEASRQMAESHSLRGYLIPRFNGEPRYQKPILYYWIQAGSIRLFGAREWAARLPSAVAGLLLVLLVHAFLLRWLAPREAPDKMRAVGRGAAFLGAAALAVMPLTAIWARAAVTDSLLTLFITGALLALLQADLETTANVASTTRIRRWYMAAAVCIALAFLTKGPVGIILPALIWLAYHLSRRTLRAAARAMPWAGGIALFLLIAAPWYLATYALDGPGFLHHFFMAENVGRFTAVMEDHGSRNRLLGLLYYLPVSLLLLFPVSAFVAHDLIAPVDAKAMPLDAGVFSRLRRFAWVWMAVIIAVFSLSATQLPSYIQAVSGAAAVLFALHLLARSTAEPSSPRQRRAGAVRQFLLAFVGLIWVGAPVAVLWHGRAAGSPLGSLPFPPLAAAIVLFLLLVSGGLFLHYLFSGNARRETLRLAGGLLAAWACLLAVLLLGFAPLVIRSQYGVSAALGRYLSSLPGQDPVLLYSRNASESVVFYSRRKVYFYVADDADAYPLFREKIERLPDALVVTDVPGLDKLGATAEMNMLRAVGPCIIMRPATAVAADPPAKMNE